MTSSSPNASSPAPGDDAREALASRCNAIEEAYEFMLAYAAQGLPSDQGSSAGSQIRVFLSKCDAALSGLADAITQCVDRLEREPLDTQGDGIGEAGQRRVALAEEVADLAAGRAALFARKPLRRIRQHELVRFFDGVAA